MSKVVGGPSWGFSIWAHNTCYYIAEDSAKPGTYTVFNKTNGKQVSAVSGTSKKDVLRQVAMALKPGEVPLAAIDTNDVGASYGPGWQSVLVGLGTDALGLGKPNPYTYNMNLVDPAKYPATPQSIIVAHPHHIVMESGTPAQHTDVLKAQQVLRDVGIDPYFSQQNFVWGPNFSHSNAYARDVATRLLAVKARGKDAVIGELVAIAEDFKQGKWN